MGEATLLKPDRKFVEEISKSGGCDVGNCFQCATCSVVCSISPDDKPFPRKEMIWAQWGLKDRLMADPDIWMCHQCNDCTKHCPRGAKPGDVLAAARRQSIIHYAIPQFLARWVSDAKMLPVLFIIPAILLGLALLVRGPIESAIPGLHHETPAVYADHVHYADLFPHWLLIVFFTGFSGLAFLLGCAGVLRFWKAAKAADEKAGRKTGVVGIIPSFIRVVIDLVTHKRFGDCTTAKPRRTSHMMVFYGFMILFAVTGWAVLVLYIITPLAGTQPGDVLNYPFGLENPAKIAANLGTIAFLIGLVLILRDRAAKSGSAGKSTSFDWMFVWILLGVVVTGIITETFRFVNVEAAGYAVYFIHLILVFSLLVYLPYSKFAHLLYRTAALVYAEHSGRRRGAAAEKKAE